MFTKDSTTKSKLSSLCKDCQRDQRKRRKPKIDEWLANNHEKVQEQQKEYSQKNSEKKRQYNQENKEYFKQKRKEYEENNKEKVKKQRQKYRRSLKGRYKKYERDAKGRGFDFELTIEEFDEITKRPCFYCGNLYEDDFGDFHSGIDRINAERGYHKWNCVSCCAICNRMKSNYPLVSWLHHIKDILDHMEKENNITILPKEERVI